MPTSFDLFGTLVDAPRPDDPASAVAAELGARGIPVPADWSAAYRDPHVDVPAGAELALTDHVAAALADRDVAADPTTVRDAVVAAFDPPCVETRPGARDAVARAADRGPVAVLSNCSVPGLADRALARSALDPAAFDAVVTSVACGWRKPDARAFRAVADRLDAALTDLVHVGDDPATDGGAADAGATSVLLSETPLNRVGEAR